MRTRDLSLQSLVPSPLDQGSYSNHHSLFHIHLRWKLRSEVQARMGQKVASHSDCCLRLLFSFRFRPLLDHPGFVLSNVEAGGSTRWQRLWRRQRKRKSGRSESNPDSWWRSHQLNPQARGLKVSKNLNCQTTKLIWTFVKNCCKELSKIAQSWHTACNIKSQCFIS